MLFFDLKLKGFLPVFSIRKTLITSIVLALSILIAASVTASATVSVFPQLQHPCLSGISFNSEGCQVQKVVVSGKPLETEAAAASVLESDVLNGINILPDVPNFDWSYGCSATSAAMLFGYYDRTGYSNIYTGPTNSGLCPLDNSVWGETDWGTSRSYECPLSATHQGVDGRESRGHVDDYWVGYEDAGPDPYLINGWAEHTLGDCTGDFMGTNQSSYGNTDGTAVFFFNIDGSAIYDYTGEEPDQRDGCHGMRLFAESRGYSVVTNFSQKIQGAEGTDPDLGFTFEDFQAEIDAGRPVLIHVKGPDQEYPTYHVMLGYGYNTTGSLVYLHDTFPDGDDIMTWGSTYSGMQHFGVTVIRLAALTPPTVITGTATGISAISATLNGNLESQGGYSIINVSFEWGTVSGNLDQETYPQLMTTTGNFTAALASLTPNTIYYFRAKATGDTIVYGPELSFVYDSINPAITVAVLDDYVNALKNVSGTASDTYPGELQKVQIILENIAEGTCWNGSDWVFIETWLDASGTSSWSYALPALGDGYTYRVKAKSIDIAGNESINVTETFLYDTTSPTATISVVGDFVNDITSVSGTSFDTSPGRLHKVQVVLQNTAGSKYWDGDSWEDAQIWVDASGTSAWSYALPALADGQTYQVKAKSIDMAGNESIEVIDTFTCDITGPSVTIADISDFVNSLTYLSGTAFDTLPGAPQKVQVILENTSDKKYWDGDSWEDARIWLDASGTSSWSYALPALADGQTYQVKAKSTDMAENESTGIIDTFTCDITCPSVTISGTGDFLNDLTSVSGTALDTLPGALRKVQILLKNTTDGNYWDGHSWKNSRVWIDASGTSSWSYALPALGDGQTYQVRVKSIDMAGNESTEVIETFPRDTISPSVTITAIEDFVNILNIISGTASDISPGELHRVEIELKNTTDSTYWNGSGWVSRETWLKASGTASWTYALPELTEGKVYRIKARSIDRAGNESTTYADAFTYNPHKRGNTFNNWLIWAVILSSIFCIGLVFLFRFAKHRI